MRLRARTMRRLALPAAFALAAGLAQTLAAPPQNSSPRPAATTNVASTQPAVPKSVFTNPSSQKEGRDPFYPKSMRLFSVVTPNTPQPSVPLTLTLSGITHRGIARLAIINNKPFEPGEEGEVAIPGIPGSRVRVHCLEIREDSALIEVGGQKQELKLLRRLGE